MHTFQTGIRRIETNRKSESRYALVLNAAAAHTTRQQRVLSSALLKLRKHLFMGSV